MHLKLGQSLQLRQSQELKQSQTIQLSYQLSLRLQQSLTYFLNSIYEDEGYGEAGSGGTIDKILMTCINRYLETIENLEMREGMKLILSNPALLELLNINKVSLAVPDKAKLAELTTDFFWEMYGGEFPIEKDGETIPEIVNVNKVKLRDAYSSPEFIEQEIKERVDLMKVSPDVVNPGMLTELKELHGAKNVIDLARSQLELINMVLIGAFSNTPELKMVLRELSIADALNFYLSEALFRKFATRFIKGLKTRDGDSFKFAFVNFIAEYVLVSMGVIDPELFETKKGFITDEQYESASKELKQIGVNMDSLMEKSNFSRRNSFFWKVYKLGGGNVSNRSTDFDVRGIITETIREDMEEILRLAKYDDFFTQVKGNAKNTYGDLRDDDEFIGILEGKVCDLLESKEFRVGIIALIKTKWFPRLAKYLTV